MLYSELLEEFTKLSSELYLLMNEQERNSHPQFCDLSITSLDTMHKICTDLYTCTHRFMNALFFHSQLCILMDEVYNSDLIIAD